MLGIRRLAFQNATDYGCILVEYSKLVAIAVHPILPFNK